MTAGSITDALLAEIPKTDLHVHLDGSLRESSLIELARDAGVGLPSDTVAGLNALVFKDQYADLPEYLAGFAYTTAALQTVEALERAAYELAEDNLAEGVRYIEVRFAPQLHMHQGLGFDQVLEAVARGLDRAQAEHAASEEVAQLGLPAFRFGIIVCAMRKFEGSFSEWFGRFHSVFKHAPAKEVHALAALELARASVKCRDDRGVPIVGFDLAGEEAGYPAHDFREAFQHAHRHFLTGTVHAGEAFGPESIFEAIAELHADRIGHGYHLFASELCGPDISDAAGYVEALAQYIADRRITIEVCITSNLQTNPAILGASDHAFRHMLDNRLSATICTDNRLISHTTVTRELQVARDALGLDLGQLKNTVMYGFKRSFFPGTYREKRAYVRQVADHYEAVLARHMGASSASSASSAPS